MNRRGVENERVLWQWGSTLSFEANIDLELESRTKDIRRERRLVWLIDSSRGAASWPVTAHRQPSAQSDLSEVDALPDELALSLSFDFDFDLSPEPSLVLFFALAASLRYDSLR